MLEEGFHFGKLEAEANKDVAKTYEVTGYPTLLYFRDGKKVGKYEGTRTDDAIAMWLYEQVNPGTQEMRSIEDLEDEIEKHDCLFVFFG